jgi:hypothetical protein
MEKFRRILNRRLALMISFNGLVIAFIVLTIMYGRMAADGSENLADMIRGFQVGIFLGLQLAILVMAVKYMRALKNDIELKKLYVEENDERTKLIQDKIGGTGFNFIIGSIAAATVIAGFLSQIVFITLLGVLLFIVLVKGSLKLYYRNKF